MKKKKWKQGQFKPTHPEKYEGDVHNIWYRSSWEMKFMLLLDGNPNIVAWASEEIPIKYISPHDNQWHRYFPDFWIRKRIKDGTVVDEIIEIKPECQTMPPNPKRKKTKKFLNESITFAINDAKWKFAAEWCRRHKIKFTVLTEKDLNI